MCIYIYISISIHAFAHNCRLSILGSSVQRVFHYKMPSPTGLSMIDSGTPLNSLIQNNTSVRDSLSRNEVLHHKKEISLKWCCGTATKRSPFKKKSMVKSKVSFQHPAVLRSCRHPPSGRGRHGLLRFYTNKPAKPSAAFFEPKQLQANMANFL